MSPANGTTPSKSGKISVAPDERKLFKDRRIELGLTQRELAVKVHATSGTISNLESGRHPQIKRDTYLRLRRVLLREQTEGDGALDEFIHGIVPDLETLDAQGRDLIKAMVDKLKKPR